MSPVWCRKLMLGRVFEGTRLTRYSLGALMNASSLLGKGNGNFHL